MDLKDIKLPNDIGWFPPANIFWLVLISILFLIFFSIIIYRKITKKTVVKSAKKILIDIKNNKSSNDKMILEQLSILLRQVVISDGNRYKTASLTGTKWLEYLDCVLEKNTNNWYQFNKKSIPKKPFTKGVGKILIDGHYQKNVSFNHAELIKLVSLWLKYYA